MGIRQGIFAVVLFRSLGGLSDQISGYDVAKAATLFVVNKIRQIHGKILTIEQLGTLFGRCWCCVRTVLDEWQEVLIEADLSLKPNAPLTWLKVTSFENSQMFIKKWPLMYSRSL